jgi:hypothetical protein
LIWECGKLKFEGIFTIRRTILISVGALLFVVPYSSKAGAVEGEILAEPIAEGASSSR